MTEITLTSEIAVTEALAAGDDLFVVRRARQSTRGSNPDESEEGQRRLIRSLLANKPSHTVPFEHGLLTVDVHCPAFVWWEWTRHRFQAIDVPGLCLAGDSAITLGGRAASGNINLYRRTIAELHKNWHVGVTDRRMPRSEWGGVQPRANGRWAARITARGEQRYLGTFNTKEEALRVRLEALAAENACRVRPLPACRNLSARTLNEQTNHFEFARVENICQVGVKELILVETDAQALRCSRDHRILTADGWKRAGDLEATDRVAVVGRRSIHPERTIPIRLRQGISLWATAQRDRLIRDVDNCHVCGRHLPRAALILDHVIPVVACLRLALDESNLRPICEPCNEVKTAGEQRLARRGLVAGSKFVRLKGRPATCAEEMTYDISMPGPWHNFVANGFVVHNSFSLESGRYRELEPVFWVPRADRPMMKPADHKPMRPRYEVASKSVRESCLFGMEQAYRAAWVVYQRHLGYGIAPEVARSVLGFGVYYHGSASGSPLAWLHFLNRRTRTPGTEASGYPQAEIEEAARQVEALFAARWPITHGVWNELGRAAP